MPTIVKYMEINFGFSTFLRMIPSGRDKPMTAIIKASTVPKAAPFPMSASKTGMMPAAFEYMGIPIKTATGTDHQAFFPMIFARKDSGT